MSERDLAPDGSTELYNTAPSVYAYAIPVASH